MVLFGTFMLPVTFCLQPLEMLVEWKGIEPSTFALRTRRSPS